MNMIYERMRFQLKYQFLGLILAIIITVIIAMVYYLVTGDMDSIIVFGPIE